MEQFGIQTLPQRKPLSPEAIDLLRGIFFGGKLNIAAAEDQAIEAAAEIRAWLKAQEDTK